MKDYRLKREKIDSTYNWVNVYRDGMFLARIIENAIKPYSKKEAIDEAYNSLHINE